MACSVVGVVLICGTVKSNTLISQEPEVLSIDVKRDSDYTEYGDSDSQNCFRLVLKLVTRKKSTGKYRCQEILRDAEPMRRGAAESTLFLYGEGKLGPWSSKRKWWRAERRNDASKRTMIIEVENPVALISVFCHFSSE